MHIYLAEDLIALNIFFSCLLFTNLSGKKDEKKEDKKVDEPAKKPTKKDSKPSGIAGAFAKSKPSKKKTEEKTEKDEEAMDVDVVTTEEPSKKKSDTERNKDDKSSSKKRWFIVFLYSFLFTFYCHLLRDFRLNLLPAKVLTHYK